MERAPERDARDERDAPSIDPIESFDTLYRKVRHCPSCASLKSFEQLDTLVLPAKLVGHVRIDLLPIDAFLCAEVSAASPKQGLAR